MGPSGEPSTLSPSAPVPLSLASTCPTGRERWCQVNRTIREKKHLRADRVDPGRVYTQSNYRHKGASGRYRLKGLQHGLLKFTPIYGRCCGARRAFGFCEYRVGDKFLGRLPLGTDHFTIHLEAREQPFRRLATAPYRRFVGLEQPPTFRGNIDASSNRDRGRRVEQALFDGRRNLSSLQ